MPKFNDIIEQISPLLIKPTSTSITLSISKRFFLFELMRKAVTVIEDEPYLNFISLLKNYKVLTHFLTGTIREFHRDRNDLYFKNFFLEKELYDLIKADIEWLAKDHGHLRVTITNRGVVIYDNYKKNQFNVLLFTIHSGSWVPKNLKDKMLYTKDMRGMEEDVASHHLYSRLVLEKGGIWIDNKQSRFACDFNRPWDKAIYHDNQEIWAQGQIWKGYPSKKDIKDIQKGYDEFYFTLAQLTDSYRFNIIVDGHTMSDFPDRPSIGIGTKYIPYFYLPIVRSMRKKLMKIGYSPVEFDKPYYGGNILLWLQQKAPDLFACLIEINKKLYMDSKRENVIPEKLEKLSKEITEIFNIGEEEQFDAPKPSGASVQPPLDQSPPKPS